MKITKKDLEKIITEETEKVLQENPAGEFLRRQFNKVDPRRYAQDAVDAGGRKLARAGKSARLDYSNLIDADNMAELSPEEAEALRDVSAYDALLDPTSQSALRKLIGKEVSRFMDTPLKQIKRYRKIAADNKAMADPIMRRIINLEKRIAELARELQELS